LAQNLLNVTDKIDQSLKDIETKEADAEVNRLRRIELINAGLTEGVAQRVMELEQLKKITLAQYDALIAEVEGRIVKEAKTAAQLATNEALREEIKLIEKRKAALEGNLGTFDATTGTGTGAIGNATTSQAGKQIQEFITTATAELNNLEQVAINVSKGIGDAVGNSLANGITGLIEGTATAKEVFAGFLRDVGQILVQEGAKMIATYIAIGIAKIGLGGGGNAATALGSNPNVAAYAPLPIGFAEGGFVTGPTSAIIGEGGESEYVIPASKMSAAMSRYSRGARGEGVIAGSGGGTEGESGAAAAGPIVVDVRYSVERINDVEYVTASQFQQGMQLAATQGAKQGEQSVLRKMQQSPSVRRRVGMS
jgi:hypothetical protein